MQPGQPGAIGVPPIVSGAMPAIPPARPPIANPVAYHMGPASIKQRLTKIAIALAMVGAFVALGIIIAGWLGGPGRYKELQTIDVKSTTSSTDGQYSLQLPKEFTALQRDADSVLYVHAAGDTADDAIYARASATAIFVGEGNMDSLRTELTAQAVKKSGAVYEGFIADQVRYIVSDAGGDIQLEDVIEASTQDGQPSLEAAFTYRNSQGDDSSGKILVVFGAKHLYILTAMSAADQWSANQSVWNQVFTTFTVDVSGT